MIDAARFTARLDFMRQLHEDRPIDPLFDVGYLTAIEELRNWVEVQLNEPTLRSIEEGAA